MADKDVKALTAEIECPVFETTAFTKLTKPLSECTVAIVTTSSLHHPDQAAFGGGDTSFRILDGSRSDWRLGHWSPNFDSSGFAVDHNVVFPIDRLRELALKGTIGRVADRHLAYAGNQFELSTVRMDTGPEGAKLLRDDGVDVVLLTPV
jgi:D-proline reductase (dithiol) PrdB